MKQITRAAIATSLALALALTPVLPPVSAQAAITASVFANGLNDPAGFTFAPDGRVFYGERPTGQVRILSSDGSSDSLFFTIPNVVSNGEQGLLGIALDPNYPASPYVFAYATRNVSGQERNQIVRITDTAGTGGSMQVIWSSVTVSGSYHDGGRILFGPDGKLYAVVGEAHTSANAQTLSNDAGKVLRMNPDGTAPSDNPFPGKLIWTYGLRNSFGFDFDPMTGRLWETENGPECNDEINRIIKGRNYGWGPNETCSHPPAAPRNTNQDGPRPVLPKVWYTPTVAPTGAAFCDGCGLGARTEGRLLFGEWETGRVVRLRLDATRKTITSSSNFYLHSSGIESVESAPDGTIFFSDPTSIWKLVKG